MKKEYKGIIIEVVLFKDESIEATTVSVGDMKPGDTGVDINDF